ncbi:MAG: alpha-amylase family glycosyl hydrolase [Planctomycetaceae bacterium]
MRRPRYPSLYQINTRVWLTGLSQTLGKPCTLDDIPDAELDRLAEQGFDWVWFLSVWQTGPGAQRVSRSHTGWRHEFEETLPDLCEDDIAGSGFAITAYTVHSRLGGDAALARLRERLRQRDLQLMLDFVPNHMGLDHPWLIDHPDYFVQGTEDDLARAPENFVRVQRAEGEQIFAYGRDPYFSGWPDTLQLDYANPALQEAMMGELVRIGEQCDGVRCDMAMLVLPDVFERTWGRRAPLFWPTATRRVRERISNFVFMAEVYWDLEWTMQQQGFDYTYDKRLYDRLRDGHATPVREHFLAGLDFQDKLARFLENHDEPRAAATFPAGIHQAAAILSFLSPGLRFFHQGQLEGKRKRISPHLVRGPQEPVDEPLAEFYERLLRLLLEPLVRDGQWQLLQCTPAWDGNTTHGSFVVFAWHNDAGERLVVAVNYSAVQGQCHVCLPFAELAGRNWQLQDRLSPAIYDWNGNDLAGRGLYLDMAPWQAAVYTWRSVDG